MSSIKYLELQGHELHKYEEQLQDLLSIYYQNPHEIYQMIKWDRIFFTAWKNGKIIGFYSCKHRATNENSIIAYLGLITVDPQYNRITGCLVFRHLEYLSKLRKRIYCYTITANPVVYKITKLFYQNVYPQKFDSADTSLPLYYNLILEHSEFSFEGKSFYKITNSPSVARYNRRYGNNLRKRPVKAMNCDETINESKGERLLILCEFKRGEEFLHLQKTFKRPWSS